MMDTLLANPVLMGLAGIVGGCILFVPSIIASARRTGRKKDISSLNAVVLLPGMGILFNGWLLPVGVLVWLSSLVWAILDKKTTGG